MSLYLRDRRRYALRELPAGPYSLSFSAGRGFPGANDRRRDRENRSDVEVELRDLVTVTGRLVDSVTRLPITNMSISASPSDGPGGWTGDDGRFVLRRVQPGGIVQLGVDNGRYALVNARRAIDKIGSADVGEPSALSSRLKPGTFPERSGSRYRPSTTW